MHCNTSWKNLIRFACIAGAAITATGCSEAPAPTYPSGDGAWLLISGERILDTNGSAVIFIREHGKEAALAAPYTFVNAGIDGGTFTVATACGDSQFLYKADGEFGYLGNTGDNLRNQPLGKDASGIPNCGLGSLLREGHKWKLVPGWQA